MYFKLPNYSDLTDQQRQFLNSDPSKNTIVQGVPGTGKSVLAVYKAKSMVKQELKILFLVFNKPLKDYIYSSLKRNHIILEADTWHAWLNKFYIQEFKHVPPQFGKFIYKWEIIKKDLQSIADTTGIIYDHVIIDEGQDLPLELYQCLKLISQNITCMLDSEQSITHEGCDTEALRPLLGELFPTTLYDNFRNTKEIYNFAKLYKPRDAQTVKSGGDKPYLLKISSNEEQLNRISAIIRRNYELNSIGILTSQDAAGRIYNYLKETLEDDYNIYPYYRDCKALKFDDSEKTDIYILTYNCMKGLEFDCVIVPELDSIRQSWSSDTGINILYVAITRATTKFYGIYRTTEARPGYVNAFAAIQGHEDLINWG